MRLLTSIWILVLGCTALQAHGQQERLQQVRDAYRNHLTMGLGNDHQRSEIWMTNTHCHRDSAHVPKAVSKVQMVTSPGQFMMKSDQICVYRDDQYTATVLPLKKVIYLGQSVQLEKTSPEDLLAMEHHIDSLLGYCKVIAWREHMSVAGLPQATVVLEPTAAAKQASGITRLVMRIETSCNRIEMVRTDFGPSNEMAYSIVEYSPLKQTAKQTALTMPVKKMVLDGNRLTAAFAGFQLIDLQHPEEGL